MTQLVLVVAMDDEAAPFLDRADRVGASSDVGHARRTALVLSGREVLLVRARIGHVAAATAAARALTEVGPVPLVSAGSAGGLATGVHVGDVVLGDRYLFAGADATAFGYSLGQVPGMPEAYTGDAELIAAAAGAGLEDAAVHVGTMLSGDAFVHAGIVERVRTDFPGALSTDMETTALAQTAHLHGSPFLSVRGISDLCGPAAGDDFRTHVDDAADRSADIVLALLAAWA
ncbi:5'-methylthioadenosine/S-adenosylhomocysteine nucleosidase [Actinotalea sp.]|uniref:5'-methylthioadenosine/S-adenosylhomocysteine nucleosidase n=1 Tax=Actinotalea sp. TaxID=1872145 RepID=UPI003564338D